MNIRSESIKYFPVPVYSFQNVRFNGDIVNVKMI